MRWNPLLSASSADERRNDFKERLLQKSEKIYCFFYLVEAKRFELSTFRMQTGRSPS
jgi:hypothetical protein